MRTLLLFAVFTSPVFSEAQKLSDYYNIEPIPLPNGETMEVGSIALMPKDRVAVTTRRGDLWICDGAYGEDLSKVKWTRFAHGLHEPFGMYWKDDSLYVTQRAEFSRIKDSDNDGYADVFETINSDWGINGDYHEYAFGTSPDKNGDVWITLCLSGSFNANSDWRGWTVRITPDGKMIPTVSGIRSPGGIGFNPEGDVFYTDNQGTWNGSSSLKWLKPGSFQGNPVGNKFHKLANLPAPPEPKDGSTPMAEHIKHPNYLPPAVFFPHGKVGNSPTAIVPDLTKGKFGPFAEQLYVGEQTHSQVQRVFLEKVNGHYQGAVFHFLEGFQAGIIPAKLDDRGIMFVGGSNRGWASRGNLPFTFERIKWTGKTPFEILTMKAERDGFTLTFTEPVDSSAEDLSSYKMKAWTYLLQSKYGSPDVEEASPEIRSAKLSGDKKSVRLVIDGLVRGHVHHLEATGVKSAKGVELWHPNAYYTLNNIPK